MGCVGAWAGVKKAPSGGLNRVWGGEVSRARRGDGLLCTFPRD